MIEIYNLPGTRSIGSFAHFKAALPTLDSLRKKGKLGRPCPAVRVSSFRGHTLTRVYRAEWHGKRWRLFTEWAAYKSNAAKCLFKKAKPKVNTSQKIARKKRSESTDEFATLDNCTPNGRQRYGMWSREF